jgi:hypothetical protein
MLADRDVGTQKDRVRGSRAVGRVIDVQRVDPDEHDARLDDRVSRRAREVRMAVEVGRRSEVPRPPGVDQHRLAPQVETSERRRLDLTPSGLHGDDQLSEVGEAVEREVGHIRPSGVPVERRVHVGPVFATSSIFPMWNVVPSA